MRAPTRLQLLSIAIVVVTGGCATAADHAIARRIADAWFARQPVATPRADLTVSEAYRVQDQLVRMLSRRLGDRCGYKVAFTGRAAQQRFGVDSPARGVLFAAMLLEDGAVLPAGFGARPHYEADLLVRVADAGVNDARTPLEVARHLGELIPFIELPDLVFAGEQRISGAHLIAANTGARLGVLGRPIPVEPTHAFVEAVGNIWVISSDGDGAELAREPGHALLGHPFNVVIWLAGHLRAHGGRLRPGDLISLGSFSPPRPVEPGQSVIVRYEGLPGGPHAVGVRFEAR
jgi:2-keto-4-pentenoate hydratase